MSKQNVCRKLKRGIWRYTGFLVIMMIFIGCKQMVWAETDSSGIVNHGLFEEGNEECLIGPSEKEEEVSWVNGFHKPLIWRVSVLEPEEHLEVKAFKGDEMIPVEEFHTGGEYEIKITDEEYNGIYRLVVTDSEGNSRECHQYVKVDRIPPKFINTEIRGRIGSNQEQLWYNAEPLKLAAKVFSEGAVLTEVFAAKNVIDTPEVDENRLLLEKEGDCYMAEITDTDCLLQTYYFYAVDEAGNRTLAEETLSFRRDSQVPIPDEITISFQASELDRNSISYEDIKENPIKKLKNLVNNIFAKKSIRVTFHAPDVIVEKYEGEVPVQISSGVVKMKFTYHGDHEYELNSQDGYFSAELPVEKLASVTDIAGKIKITELEDAAGNLCRLDSGKEIKTQGMIILDDVAPILSKVSYIPQTNAQTIGNLQYYFYQTSAKASVEILETNFEGVLNEKEKMRLPVAAGVRLNEWFYNAQTHIASSTIEFFDAEGEEKEYDYSLFYRDPSGNLMEGKAPIVCEDGKYGKDVVVIDKRPPVLKNFLIETNSEIEFMEEDGLLYAANAAGDDIKITIVIDDNEKYFNKENILLEYSVDGVTWSAIEYEAECTVEKRNHKLVYTFDGEENEELMYRFRVTYQDRAGNAMTLPENYSLPVEKIEDGSYKSVKKIVLDHGNPKLKILKFSNPIQMFQGEKETDNGEVTATIIDKSTKLYYDTEAKVSFELEERFLKVDDVNIELYYRENKSEKWKLWENIPNSKIVKKEMGIDADFTLPVVEAEYYFTISYTDFSGNPMIYEKQVVDTKINEAYAEGIVKGTNVYVSPIFVVDIKEPVYEVFYDQKPEKYNRVDEIETVLTLSEMNLDTKNTKIKIQAKDINGNAVFVEELEQFEYQQESGIYVASWETLSGTAVKGPVYPDFPESTALNLKLCTEANYSICVEVIDKVGKKAIYETAYCIDRTAPSITVVTKDGQYITDAVKVQCGLLDFSKSDITYTVVDRGIFDRIIDKLTFGYFSKSKVLVHVEVHDAIGGVAKLEPTCIDEGVKMTSYKLSEQIAVKDDKSVVKYEIELPIDFKGTVQMHGIDHAKNVAKDTGAIGIIVETEKQHEKYAKNSIEILTPYSKTPDYYKGDVEITYCSEDRYSGLCQVNYQAGNYDEKITYPAGENICTEALKKHTILAKENNGNKVNLALSFFDNAGHEEKLSKEQMPVIHIDQTKPKIQVVYDNVEVENEIYYKADRIATVTIMERNFDPEDTNLWITGPKTKVTDWNHIAGRECKGGTNPSDINHKDDCKWVTKIYFTMDGAYTFTCDTTDLAGNKSTYEQKDVFIIDKTLPEITVTYDNHKAKNGIYYKEPRTATIEIKEHNFKESDVKIRVSAINNEEVLPAPVINSWISDGEYHRTTIVYDYDAQFCFEMSYADLAGNKAEEYEKDIFVVDLTAPVLEVFGVLDGSANNDVVMPGVRYTDVNYDINEVDLQINGYKNGSVKLEHLKREINQGVELKTEDVPCLPEMDDLYTLYAVGDDLAGNRSEKTIRFSVNRFGSVYTFDEKTEALVGEHGSYYTKEEPTIVVYETNVDTLKFKEITLNVNGKLKTLVENSDFKVYENGDSRSWKQYTYEIAKENFLEEGIYVLTIYSEDRAKNISDNHTKGQKIEFVVDKTPPSALLIGIENEKQYREVSKEITIDVEDNVCVGYIEILLNGETITYNSMEIAKMDGRKTYTLKSRNDWQRIQMIAYDAAGNVTSTETFKVLITPNILIQLYRNQVVFYTSLSMIVLITGSILVYILKQKKKTKTTSS